MKIYFFILLFFFYCTHLSAQLKIGNVHSEINFREGPGVNYKISHKVNSSNLLIILPRKAQNGFVEAFDVETSLRGYIYESLIRITDTLLFQKQKFFERAGESSTGDVEISLINHTDNTLFVWINKISYDLYPHEKKVLLFYSEEIIYFASAPGLFPVFGKEILKKGNMYFWDFTL